MRKLVLLFGLFSATSLFAAGLQKVEVQVDGADFVQAQGLENWFLGLDTILMDNGQHKVMAKAIDSNENISEIKTVAFNVLNPAELSLEPAGASILTGDTFVLEIRMKTNARIGVNAAQAVITFPPILEAVSLDNVGSAFSILAPVSVSPGLAKITVANITSVAGDQLVGHITFRALAPGEAQIRLISDGSSNGSELLRPKDSKDILTAVSGGTYEIMVAADVTPPTVEIQAPAPDQTVSDIFTISGTAQDK